MWECLAGIMPTRDRGLVWFTINRGADVRFRWARPAASTSSAAIASGTRTPHPLIPHPASSNSSQLGAPERNEILYSYS